MTRAAWRARHRRVGACASVLCALHVLGCGAGSDGPIEDQGVADASVDASMGFDQGPLGDMGMLEDNGLPDQGVDDLGTVFPADPARFAPFAAQALGTFGPANDIFPPAWTACYDEQDGHSCASSPCALLATCCVATGDCASPASDGALPTALSFSTCASGASALSCVPGQPLVALGTSTPTVEAGGMRPGGDGTDEGGVLVGTPLDLRVERLALRVVFAPPLTCPDGVCLESASVSIAPASEVALGVVRPVAGLLYSASRADVSLVIGTQLRASWPLDDPDAAFTLELLPSGEVRVLRDDALLSDALRYVPPADAQVVLHGHNSELQGARVRSLQTQRYQSEAPSTFGARTVITLLAPSDVSPFRPRGASVVQHQGRTFVVVENDGALYRGELLGDTVAFDSAHRVVVDEGLGEIRLTAPTLVLRDDGETALVYAADLPDGRSVIRARRGSDGALGPLPETLAVADAGELQSLDDPSVIVHDERYLLVVRRVNGAGGSNLELWMSARGPGATLRDMQRSPATNLSDLTRVVPGAALQNEVRAPHLSVRGGTYRLHYERRAGTRSAVELLVSDELRVFRRLGEVLGPRPGQVDALGVGSPTALQGTTGPDEGTEWLFVMGRDGVTERLLRTARTGVLDPTDLRP